MEEGKLDGLEVPAPKPRKSETQAESTPVIRRIEPTPVSKMEPSDSVSSNGGDAAWGPTMEPADS